MRAHCYRCDRETEGVYARPRMRKLAWGYVLLIVPFLPFLPIIGSDYVVMIPTLMIYLLGLGPVFGIIREQPTCSDCGAFMPTKPVPRIRGDIAPSRRNTSPGLDTPDV